MISILGNNKFAYSTGCDEDVTTEQLTRGFRRESSGLLQRFPPTIDLPTAKAGDIYCPYALASDPSNHLAFVLRQLHLDVDEGEPDGCDKLGIAYASGNGAPKDPARAFALERDACESGLPNACATYGMMMADGVGTEANVAAAVPYLAFACRRAAMQSCAKLTALKKPVPELDL